MLPQQRAAPAADVKRSAVDDHSGGQEKAGCGRPVHQLHDNRGLKRRKGEQKQERGHKLRPDEKRKSHPSEPFRAQLNDRGNEVHCAEQRGRDQENKSNQPQGLAVEKRMEPRPFVRDIG